MYLAGLLLGFTGSVHCMGMCSPLAMAVTNLSSRTMLNRLLYNLGRIITYGGLGLAAASTAALFPVAAYQGAISVTLGALLLIMGVAGISAVKIPLISSMLARFIVLLKRAFANYLQKRNIGAVLLLGIINGFLPCGLTFIALIQCLTLTSPWEGLSFMIWFGAGTLPAMLGASMILNTMIKKFQWNARYVMTVLLVVSGSFLIARVFITQHHHLNATIEPATVICR